MRSKDVLVAAVLQTVLAVVLCTLPAAASETHLQIQNQSVTRHRPGVPEHCIYFNPAALHVGYFPDRKSVDLVAEPLRTISTFESRDEATRSLNALRHLGVNELCVAANSRLSYMLVSGKAATGRLQGEKSVLFEPRILRVERADNEWRLQSGSSTLLSFGPDEKAAKDALRIINYYGFNAKCCIGGETGKGIVLLYAVPQSDELKKKRYLEAKAGTRP